jgi:hypothetical protein
MVSHEWTPAQGGQGGPFVELFLKNQNYPVVTRNAGWLAQKSHMPRIIMFLRTLYGRIHSARGKRGGEMSARRGNLRAPSAMQRNIACSTIMPEKKPSCSPSPGQQGAAKGLGFISPETPEKFARADRELITCCDPMITGPSSSSDSDSTR